MTAFDRFEPSARPRLAPALAPVLRWAAIGLSLLILAAPAAAETAWSRMARSLASSQKNPPAAPRAAQASAPAPTPATAVAVPDENAAGPVTKARAVTAQVTAYQAEASLAATPATGKAGGGVGSESEDTEELLATNLFKKPEIRRLIGDSPRFIYDPSSRPDPMLVPWVRRKAIYDELSLQADALLKAGQAEKAVALYQRILNLKDPRFSAEVLAKLAEISKVKQATVVAAAVEQKVELPPWVQDNTTGVIVAPGKSTCLVGEYVLHIGDALPNYPEIKVASIAAKRVVYQIKDKTFEVKLADAR